MTLSELESIIGVKFPKKWHEIYNTGAMEWLEAGVGVFLMLSCDCEPLMFDEIPERIEEVGEWI